MPPRKKKESRPTPTNVQTRSSTRQRTLRDLLKKPTDETSAISPVALETSTSLSAEDSHEPLDIQPVPSSHSYSTRTLSIPGTVPSSSNPTTLYPLFAKSLRSVLPSSNSSPAEELVDVSSDYSAIPNSSQPSSPRPSVSSTAGSALSSPRSSPPPQGTQSAPIFIESSPIKIIIRPPRRLNRTLGEAEQTETTAHPFFAARKTQTTSNTIHHGSTSQFETGRSSLPPFPLDTHIRGSQTNFYAPTPPISRKEKVDEIMNALPSLPGGEGLKPFLDSRHDLTGHTRLLHTPRIYSSAELENCIKSIPATHAALSPPIKRLIACARSRISSNPGPSAPTQQHWADKYAPRLAQDVIWNEENASFLRDWLSALQLDSATVTSSVARDVQSEDEAAATGGKRKRKGKKSVAPKKPTVLRAVVKPRGRKRRRVDSEDEEDDWIVHGSDNYDDDMPGGEDEEDELLLAASSSKGVSRPGPPPIGGNVPTRAAFDHYLTNTILLTGPSGSGKTAAVYACATELGYEVFEVYPGIGKRSGANIEALVGDVGKNHLVNTAESVKKNRAQEGLLSIATPNAGIAGFFAGKKLASTKTDPPFAAPEIIPSESVTSVNGLSLMQGVASDADSEPPANVAVIPPNTQPRVGQSIILLEEVDVLFKEDVNFWPTVINIIKDSKRPVIMTCNDTNQISLEDLPLQDVLTFTPVPVPLATSYIHAVALAEGHLISHEDARKLYEETFELNPSDLPDTPMHPLSQGLPVPDLRRSLNQLQLRCHAVPSTPSDHLEDAAQVAPRSRTQDEDGAAGEPSPPATEQLRLLRLLQRCTDSLSFEDSWLSRRPGDTVEAPDSYAPSADDEVGYPVLYPDDAVSGLAHVLGSFYSHDSSIAEEVKSRATATLREENVPDGYKEALVHSVFRARADYQRQLLDVLRDMLAIWAPLLPRPAVFLDYEAWIRHMVNVDDDLEARWATSVASGRGALFATTARSTRSTPRYARWIDLADDLRRILAETALCWPGDDSIPSLPPAMFTAGTG